MSKRLFPGMAAVLFLAGVPASASPSYPGEIERKLGLSYTPSCALCHAAGLTGFGTVTTPFGQSMRSRGLVADNIQSLDTALDALAAEMTDSDHDGVPDIDELKAGTDPNGLSATYGCFNVTGEGLGAGAAVAWLLVLSVALRPRRRTG